MPAVYQIGQTEGECSRPRVPIVWRRIGAGFAATARSNRSRR